MLNKRPGLRDLVFVVERFLARDHDGGVVDTRDYEFRIACKLQQLALRELEIRPAQDEEELRWLAGRLKSKSRDLPTLRREFRDRVLSGEFSFDSALVQQYLWSSTCDALETDNPGYASYRRFTEESGERPGWRDS